MSPLALVAAASGIGDVVRMTPLVRALYRLGYTVDVLLSPDYPDTVALVEGAPEIRRVFYVPARWGEPAPERSAGLADQCYDVAVFTLLALPLRGRVRAGRVLSFHPAQWRQEGDLACAARIAGLLGWQGALPPPFVRTAERRFALPPDTVALHPGCKPGWPWKRWHGFEALARALPSVALVGTAADRGGAGSYFRASDAWPSHVRDFTGRLALPETAALLRQCAALVSNDSGLMHVAAALGVPTFGIFGLTSPAREALPLANMVAITGGLPCEPACRRQPWGRRDCEHHLACLRSLEPETVLRRVLAHPAVAERLGARPGSEPAAPPRPPLDAEAAHG